MSSRWPKVFAFTAVLGTNVLLGAAEAAPPAPRKMFAIANGRSGPAGDVPNNPADTIMFYDVTAIGPGGPTSGVFGDQPLFSIWMGYEVFDGEVGDVAGGVPRGDREEISAITVNPANGTIYVGSFDSGTSGVDAKSGDSIGDMDLYRINYQAILKDFVTNSRPVGTVYAPDTQRISMDDETFLESIASPLFDGTVDGVAHNIPHPTALTYTQFVSNAFQKIGEVGRPQSPITFFDVELDFVNPATMVFLDSPTTTGGATGDPAGDFQIRAWQRISRTPGLATMDLDGPDNMTGPPGNPVTYDDAQGGYNGNTLESWKSTIIGRPMMDANMTDVGGWAYVQRDGKYGVWIADNELNQTGDQIAYFELDFSGPTPTATKKPLVTATPGSTSFRVDENPTANAATSDGEIDFLYVDKNGNLVIGESGFFDTTAGSTTPPLGSGGLTAQQPKVLTLGIESYSNPTGPLPAGYTASGGTVTFDSTDPWATSANMAPAVSDDNDVLNTTRVGYDKYSGYIYVIDQDADFFEDIYVFDPVTGTMVYQELNAMNPSLFNTGTQEIFVRGDINGDGSMTYADVKALKAGIADPTLGGTVTADLGAEWYDLTGDLALTEDDLTELVSGILGTALGDFNFDGLVDGADLAAWRAGYGNHFDGGDLLDWQRNVGFNNMALAAVPEPAGAVLAALACAGLATKGVRNRFCFERRAEQKGSWNLFLGPRRRAALGGMAAPSLRCSARFACPRGRGHGARRRADSGKRWMMANRTRCSPPPQPSPRRGEGAGGGRRINPSGPRCATQRRQAEPDLHPPARAALPPGTEQK